MSKSNETKKKETVVGIKPVDIKAPAVSVAEPGSTPPDIKSFLPVKNNKLSDEKVEELAENYKRETANVELIDKLEREEIREVLLQDYYQGCIAGIDDGEATSSVTINGEKLEPLIKGVKRTFESLTLSFSSRGFSFARPRRGKRRIDEMDETVSFDIYVYKTKNKDRRNGLMSPISSIDALTKKLKDGYFYQILILGPNSSVTITNELKEPSPYALEGDFWGGAYGLLVAREATLTNCLFFNNNVIDSVTLDDVTLRDTVIAEGKYGQRSQITNCDIESSTLDSTYITLSVKHSFMRGKIRKSDLTETRFTGERLSIGRSRLKHVSFNGRGVTVVRSRMTKLTLSAKDDVEVRNTVLHHEDNYYYSTGESIKLDSVFDAMVSRYSNGASVYLIRGRNSFWVGANGSEINEAPIELKNGPVSTEVPYRFGRDMCHDGTSGLLNFIKRAVRSELGKSDLSRQIIDNIHRQISERMAISNTIKTANNIRNSSDNGYYF